MIVAAKKLFPHFSMGQITMLADGAIIVLGWPVYGNMDAVLYGVVSAFAASVVVDKIMYGAGAGKLVIIITTEAKRISQRIDETVGRGSTLIEATGAYSDAPRELILCACSKSEIYKVQNAAHEIDPDAFVTVSYTHLDVYKRQVPKSAREGFCGARGRKTHAGPHGAGTCLFCIQNI